LVHMRPYLWFVSGFAGMVGAFVSLEQFNHRFLLAIIPFFLSYGFGQALTDCFQIDTDKLSAPYRPLSKGIIAKEHVLYVSVIGLIICGIILVYLNTYNTLFAIISIIGLATYSFTKKRFWFLGPPHNSLIVAMLPIMGFLSFSKTPVKLVFEEISSIALVVFLAYNVFVLMGYLKDITADKQAGYRTFTVVWGWDMTTFLCDILYVWVFCLILIEGWLNGLNWIYFLAAVLMAISGQFMAHFQKTKSEEFAFFPIIQSVRSFLLICYTLIYNYSPDIFWYLILVHILFEITLFLRPEKKQI